MIFWVRNIHKMSIDAIEYFRHWEFRFPKICEKLCSFQFELPKTISFSIFNFDSPLSLIQCAYLPNFIQIHNNNFHCNYCKLGQSCQSFTEILFHVTSNMRQILTKMIVAVWNTSLVTHIYIWLSQAIRVNRRT